MPAYDMWFDNTYVKRWGQANDTEVHVDHVNQADFPARAAAEVAAQSGHDLFQFLSPPAAYEDQVVASTTSSRRSTKKLGKMGRVARRRPTTRGRRSTSASPTTTSRTPCTTAPTLGRGRAQRRRRWDDVRKAAPKLKATGHPIGIGMSQELDSNMALIALMMCFGGFLQNEEQPGHAEQQGHARRAQLHARHLQARDDERGLRAGRRPRTTRPSSPGRLSLALNAISITRTRRAREPSSRQDIASPDPEGRRAGSGSST